MTIEQLLDRIQQSLKNGDNIIKLLRYEFMLGEEGNDRKKEIKELIVHSVKNKGSSTIALLFGTGISAGEPYKLKNWRELVQDIYCKYLFIRGQSENTSLETLVNSLSSSVDLYELAQYVQDNLRQDLLGAKGDRDDRKIAEAVERKMFYLIKQSLYTSKDRTAMDQYWREGESKKNKNTIRCLCDFVERCNIKRIITYNYDDVFEHAMDCLKPNIQVNPVFVDDQLSQLVHNDVCNIYHVHGFAPKFSIESLSNSVKEYLNCQEAKNLVLSEDDYDEIGNVQYKWRNIVQADTFLRFNWFIFGFSLADKNFKRILRLLDWHRNDKAMGDVPLKHYIFFSVSKIIDSIFELQNKTAFSKMKDLSARCELLYNFLHIKRQYLQRYHVIPVWTTHEDLPSLLEDLLRSPSVVAGGC